MLSGVEPPGGLVVASISSWAACAAPCRPKAQAFFSVRPKLRWSRGRFGVELPPR